MAVEVASLEGLEAQGQARDNTTFLAYQNIRIQAYLEA
jgi:hypothetical protein